MTKVLVIIVIVLAVAIEEVVVIDRETLHRLVSVVIIHNYPTITSPHFYCISVNNQRPVIWIYINVMEYRRQPNMSCNQKTRSLHILVFG